MAITNTEYKVIKKYKELSKCLLKENSPYNEQDVITLLKFMFELTDKGFEYYVKDFFSKGKYDKIKVTGGLDDGGIDIEGKFGNKITLIQCKQYKNSHVQDKELLKFIKDTKKYKKRIGNIKPISLYFITTSWVNQEAKDLAEQYNIEIKDYKNMIKMDKNLDVYKYIEDHKNDEKIVTGINVYDILDKKYWVQAFGKTIGTINYYINKFIFKNYYLDYQKVEKYHPKKEKSITVKMPGYPE